MFVNYLIICFFIFFYSTNLFSAASDPNNIQSMVEFLIDRPKQGSNFSKYDINSALISAVKKGRVDLVELLINQKDGNFRPSQVFGINKALEYASGNGKKIIVEFFLNRQHGQLQPNQDGIINAYREALANRQAEIVRLLTPHVPAEERIFQENSRGIAFEIHNYSNAFVIADNNSKNVANSEPPKLIDAVFDNMSKRIKHLKLISFSDIEILLSKSIDKYIDPKSWEEAKIASLYRLSADVSYEQELRIAVTFIKNFHPDKIEHWIQGFVGESINAYANRNNPTSCSKGIKERVATGLRGIDSELDKLFAQVEGPLLMSNWLKMWNITAVEDSVKITLSKQLTKKGINHESSTDMVVKAFKEIAQERLKEYRIENNQISLSEIEIYADLINDTYEEYLKLHFSKKAEP